MDNLTLPQARAQFNQTLTDIIQIFWEVHKLRLDVNETIFCGTKQKPHNPNTHLNTNVIETYSNLVASATLDSWWTFLNSCGAEVPRGITEKLAQNYDSFTGGYTRALIQKNRVLADKYPDVVQVKSQGTYDLYDSIDRGFATGANVTVQLAALYEGGIGKWLEPPVVALMLSKVHVANIKQARAGIGLHDSHSYPLLTPKNPEVDRQKLTQMGYGEAYGCPAGRKVSKQTRQYLQSLGVYVKNPVIVELTERVHEDFKARVMPWYRSLTTDQKMARVKDQNIDILEGFIKVG